MDKLKELEIQGCRSFVCPNLGVMETRCKGSNIRDGVIERSKCLAIEYFKKTYHRPHYSSARNVIPAIVYIASIFEDEKRSKAEIAKIFGVSHVTIRKWQIDVMKVLDIKILEKEKKLEPKAEIDYQFCEIDREGKILMLNDSTIEMTKHLMSKYFKIENFDRHYSRISHLRAAFIYTAAIIENDRRTQIEMWRVLGVNEAIIGHWHRNIIKVLGLKIISHQRHTIIVFEGQYNS